jgi:NAD(P)-dependent dehydrogenase (short-subunit alcohol dehydrogenase family)
MKKLILVTGSSGGIGKAIIEKFIAEGYIVIGLDKKSIKIRNPNFQFFKYDLTQIKNKNDIKALEKKLNILIGEKQLIGLVNNCAIQILERNLNPESLYKTFMVNTFAPLFLAQINANRLIRNKGTVINISSIHATLTKKRFLQYAASKAALGSITRSLALEFGGKIKFISISPGAIDTSMLRSGLVNTTVETLNRTQVIGKVGQPEEIANVVFYLVTQGPEILNGTDIAADGGNSKLLNDV